MPSGPSRCTLGRAVTDSFFNVRPGASNPAASQAGRLLRELTISKNPTYAPAAEAITSLKRRFAAKP